MSQIVFNFLHSRARLPALSSASSNIFRGNSSLRFKDKYFHICLHFLKKAKLAGLQDLLSLSAHWLFSPLYSHTLPLWKTPPLRLKRCCRDQLQAVHTWGIECESEGQRQTVWRMACGPNSGDTVRGSQANSPARLTNQRLSRRSSRQDKTNWFSRFCFTKPPIIFEKIHFLDSYRWHHL